MQSMSNFKREVNKMRKKKIKRQSQRVKYLFGTQRMIIAAIEVQWYKPQIKYDFKRTQ